MKLVVYWI
nr:unnamed protein product [Callosobruchus chinensis]CAH7740897.1 unnamed protein product [Callosobruchus chinensis]